ncbi:CoA-substrate-specific enzyme activase, putative [Thermanaerovibrio velox DSM 12556]|uniref:CoA-substrate-specific enzyme activase, putative n=1 Tax=Thermanaerovibrio velox DSM 12556 TaxID=926567 RepID=H0UPU5_9BACT|nr:acyl-CoA dehydratase activase [Thermanaerovibrio velox]EHM10654.1 CoA-substrate-specific enzyme activase, putative [Thermanaerovibrio velox DSM 12556]
MTALGIDAGSRFIKWVLLDGRRIADMGRISSEGADLRSLPSRLPRAPLAGLTGYGRHLLRDVFDNFCVVSEISAHAMGARMLEPGERLLMDVGGQDSKALEMDASGKVLDFRVNDRCAAGTGRFLENMARVMGCDIREMIGEAMGSGESVEVSSMCAVFAESEVISLLNRGVGRGAVAKGMFRSLARRLEALGSFLSPGGVFAFTGGLSELDGAWELLSTDRMRLKPVKDGAYAGALGAALSALRGSSSG